MLIKVLNVDIVLLKFVDKSHHFDNSRLYVGSFVSEAGIKGRDK